jgi:transposase-like protein
MATKKKRRRFTPEYKAEVVALVRKGEKTAGQIARDLELTETHAIGAGSFLPPACRRSLDC